MTSLPVDHDYRRFAAMIHARKWKQESRMSARWQMRQNIAWIAEWRRRWLAEGRWMPWGNSMRPPALSTLMLIRKRSFA